ncbi:hypothetical protein [Mycobacterium asiaticum]|uniref:hypothetical protein n=1 Tax=Mycobacterium asiaticum TaxID=1790 RepID=UPI0015610AC2|nr:hypothetical protein [Mycobacterium asiaticum]
MDVYSGRDRTVHLRQVLAQMPRFAPDVQDRVAPTDVVSEHKGLAFQPLPQDPRGPRYEGRLRSPPGAPPVRAAVGSPAIIGEKALQGGHLGPFDQL